MVAWLRCKPYEMDPVLGWFSDRWRDAGYTMALPDRALQVLNLMGQSGLGQRPLLFISHSLGGLLAKQILRKASDTNNPQMKTVAANTRAVLFLATPHAGADLASLMDAFSAVLGATVSDEDLRAHDAHLRDLFDWYRNHALGLGIETVTYYEMRGVRGVLPIVKPGFAHPGIGADPVPLDEDHLSIAKPRSRDAQVYGAARDLLANYVLTNKGGRETPPQFSSPGESRREPHEVIVKLDASALASTEARIPHELPPAAEAFFGRSTELNQLIGRLREGRNTAVVGPAGLGKTALAARALHAVVGDKPRTLAASPYPDGVVFLDLYTLRGQCEPAWNTLANKLAGAGFMDRSPARERATQACIARHILIVIEGGEEADGTDGRCGIDELLSVLSPQNRRLLLTRLSTQAARNETVELKEALQPDDAAQLLDSLTAGRLSVEVRERLLQLLEGHPLALTWAGNLVALDDDDPKRLVEEWSGERLPKLSDPTQAGRTLEWLFERSTRGLDTFAEQVLTAAGLLARAPFPFAAMRAALGNGEAEPDQITRDALKSLAHRGLLRRLSEDHWEFTHVLGYGFARKETGTDPALRTRLAQWLREYIGTVLEAASHDDDAISLARLLEHTGALMRADDDQQLWLPLVNYLLYDACDRLIELGRLDVVKLDLDGVGDWLERFPSPKLQIPEWLRERSVLLNRRGDVLSDQGDLAGALAVFRESLAVSQRLASADPSNAIWQRDLSVSHIKLGDVLRAQGDLAGALAAFRESLAVSQRLASADPSNAIWQRDLSVSQDSVGDVLRAQGDLAGAVAAFRESLAVSQRLASADPSNAAWQRDLSVSYTKLADVLSDQGDLAGALAVFRESLAVSQRLASADTSNAGWQRDLSVSQDNVGNVLRDQGDLAGALAAFRESLVVRQRLASTDPSNAIWQRDLSVSQEKIGDVLRAQGDLAGALAAFRESLAVSQRLASADPGNAGWQRDLSVSHNKLGDVLRDQGDLAGALAAFRESLAVSQRLASADPSNAGWQRDLSVCHNKIGDVLRDQGDLAGALAAFRESLAVRQRLASADPSNAGWQRDLSVSQDKVGNVLRAQGDLAGALAAFRESLAVRQRLASADPSNAGWQRDLSVSQDRVGDVLRAQGDLAGALAAFRESLAVSQRLASADPSNAGWQRDLSLSLTMLAEFHDDEGKREEALRYAEESLKIDERLAALDPTNATWQKDVAVSRALVARLRAAKTP